MFMELLVVSDLHLDVSRWGKPVPGGINTAYQTAIATWEYSCEQAIQRRPAALVLTGDVFHNGHPWPQAIASIGAGIHKVTAAGIEVVLLGGNHELLGLPAGQCHVLQLWEHNPDVHCVLTPQWLHLKNIDISLACLPWPSRPKLVQLLGNQSPHQLDLAISGWLVDQLAVLADTAPTDRTMMLIGHAMVTGARLLGSEQTIAPHLLGGPTGPTIDPASLMAGPWKAGILGHVHCHQLLAPNLYYAGTPWTIDFADAGVPHGPLLVDVPSTGPVTLSMLPGPDRRLIKIEAQPGMPPDITEDISGAMVRLVLPDASAALVQQVRADIARQGGVMVDIQVPVTPPARPELHPIAQNVDTIEALTTWAKQRDLSEVRTSGMIEKAKQLLADF